MFQALPIMLAWTLLILAVGAALCGYVAFRLPLLWLLWPLLFGVDMFVFGMFAGFSPPNPGGVLLWRTLAAAFIVVPAFSSLYGRARKLRLAVSQSERHRGGA
jgi:hypothetical protein